MQAGQNRCSSLLTILSILGCCTENAPIRTYMLVDVQSMLLSKSKVRALEDNRMQCRDAQTLKHDMIEVDGTRPCAIQRGYDGQIQSTMGQRKLESRTKSGLITP
jgi:hypothetical protein